MSTGEAKIRISAENKAGPALKQTETQLHGVGVAASGVVTQLAKMGLAFATLDFAVGQVKGAAVEYLAFEKSIARIGTLIPGQGKQLAALSDEIRKLSTASGLAADDLSAGAFQALSAGVNASDMAGFLKTAAANAVAGFNSMEESVSGITTIINAYGLSIGEATRISDAMFVANKLGVTTSKELSASIGDVVSMAATLGVSYQDLFSATVSLTTAGINTSKSMTGLQAILAGALRPSGDAAKVAEELGLQWNASALQAGGLAGMIDTLRVAMATGGEEAVSRLVPSVEGLRVAMRLASDEGARKFTGALKEMQTQTGQTAEAVNEATKTMGHQVDVLSRRWEELKRQAGDAAVATGLAEGALRKATDPLDKLGVIFKRDFSKETQAERIRLMIDFAHAMDPTPISKKMMEYVESTDKVKVRVDDVINKLAYAFSSDRVNEARAYRGAIVDLSRSLEDLSAKTKEAAEESGRAVQLAGFLGANSPNIKGLAKSILDRSKAQDAASTAPAKASGGSTRQTVRSGDYGADAALALLDLESEGFRSGGATGLPGPGAGLGYASGVAAQGEVNAAGREYQKQQDEFAAKQAKAQQEYERAQRDAAGEMARSAEAASRAQEQMAIQGINAANALGTLAINSIMADENMKQMFGKLLQSTGQVVSQYGGAYGAAIGAAMQIGGTALERIGTGEQMTDSRRARASAERYSRQNPMPVAVVEWDMMPETTIVNLSVAGSIVRERELGRYVDRSMQRSDRDGMTRTGRQG